MSDRNGARRGAAPWGAAPYLGTLCLEVQITKSACATQSHASARSYIFIYILPNCTSTAGLILPDGWTFFDRLGGWKMKKDTAIPPGHRRILKRGRLYHTLRILIFQKKTAASFSKAAANMREELLLYGDFFLLLPHNRKIF